MKITAVVCTYNRAALLQLCLESLVNQTRPGSLYEVLIINNNGTADTAAIAEKFAQKHSNFRVFFEPTQGLSHARNRGWKEARGEYVAYIDDDAKVPENWIQEIYAFIERNPDVQAFGGPYVAFADTPLPDWFPKSYGSWSLGDEERAIRIGREWLNGTNMVFSKALLEEMGGFNPKLGMSGDKISYGEETRLLLEIDRKGIPVYYAPEIRVDHFLAKSKLSLRALLKSSYLNGLGYQRIFDQRRSLLSHMGGLFLTATRSLRCLFPDGNRFKTRVYDHGAPFFYELGALAGALLKNTGTD
jgi:glycosyltransferase involved in cell wall biosynthesis